MFKPGIKTHLDKTGLSMFPNRAVTKLGLHKPALLNFVIVTEHDPDKP